MRYILLSDLHGNVQAYDALMILLESRGWEGLYHPDETLIVMGDSSDRGDYSLYLHWLFSMSDSVIHLMGNHDYKIVRWNYGYKGEFSPTKEQLEGRPEIAKHVVNAVLDYPYRFVGPGFIAAHAYPFATTEEGFIYGPNDRGVRIPWWEEYEKQDYATFFGHYHATGDMMWPEKRLYCLDNLDADLFTYAIIEDGQEEIYSLDLNDVSQEHRRIV